MRLSTSLLAVLLLLAPASAPAAPGAAPPRAQVLFDRALAHLRRNTIDDRRFAIEALEEATRLAPGSATYEITLARIYYEAGFLRLARERFERVARLEPSDAQARIGLAQVWRRDWLKYLDQTSLARAVDQLSIAARLDPDRIDAWLTIVPLLVEQKKLEAAAAAAARAAEADPSRPEALIEEAYTAYRLGRVARADSLFAVAVPRLRRSVRELFDDIAPVATARDTFVLHRLSQAQQAKFVRQFWKEHDPDLATPENEALLEYWSRVSHAYFLYFDPKRRAWDERGELYVRYGAPETADYNPVGEKLYVTSPFGRAFPANILLWEWPTLGMRVALQDRLLSEYFQLPIDLYEDPDPAPDPDSLASRGDAIATAGGRGVFPMLPPGVKPRPIDGALARFEGEGGPRLLAQLEAAGDPGDSLSAEWVVLDSARAEVARAARVLIPSACDPAEAQVGDFAAELPPGHYVVGLTVRDREGRRGLFRASADLARSDSALGLSDVVVSCGLPFPGSLASGAPAVRLEPNPAARVSGSDPLTAYFEIYHLAAGPDGRAHFEYVYTVSTAERDRRVWIQRALQPRPRRLPLISASRAEEQEGALRRQFVSVPIEALPAGRYRLEIRVRDLIAGGDATGSVEFTREGTPATPKNALERGAPDR